MSDRTVVTSKSLVKSARKRRWQMPTILKQLGVKNFVWVFGVIGVAALLHLKGTPHILFEYTYAGSKSRKIDCTYLGLNPQTIAATDGHCSIIRLLRAKP